MNPHPPSRLSRLKSLVDKRRAQVRKLKSELKAARDLLNVTQARIRTAAQTTAKAEAEIQRFLINT